MAQIFLSYASADRHRVIPLVEMLVHNGFDVWWDRELHTGGTFDADIESAVDDASCILVVWSNESVTSRWVRAEAHEGLDRNLLVPVAIDDVRPPLVFRQVQTARLVGWPAERDASQLRSMLAAIQAILGSTTSANVDAGSTRSSLTQQRSLAVLPLAGLSADADTQSFADGLTEQVLDVLARLPDLQVATRTSSLRFRDSASGDARAIGTQLNVNYLVEGSVRRAGERIRISIRLGRAVDGYTLWTHNYDRELADVFAVQDDVAARVASAVQSAFRDQEVTGAARQRTSNPRARDEFLKAQHYDREMHRGGSEAVERIRTHCERAIELDADYLDAYLLLADTYLNRMGYRMSLAEARPHAQRALERATELAPNDPALMLRLAELHRTGHDYAGALDMYARCWRAAPDEVHVDYATTLFTVGRLDEAIAVFRHNLELDPENFSLWYYLGAAQYGKRDTAAAITSYQRSLAVVEGGFLADGVRATLAGTWVLAGDNQRAAQVLAPCLQPSATRIELEIGLIACVQGMLGDPEPARRTLAELVQRATDGHLDPQGPFWAALGSGDHEAALDWLERVVAEDAFPTVYFLTSWSLLDPLRTSPRFAAALAAGGLDANL